LIILIISGKEYKLWSSSLCSFLQSTITSWEENIKVDFIEIGYEGVGWFEKASDRILCEYCAKLQVP
jgi:hypothetical protein